MSYSYFDSWLTDLKLDFYNELALRDPRAQAKIVLVETPPPYWGFDLRENSWIPPGTIMIEQEQKIVWLAPYDRYGMRTGIQQFKPAPLWTRHCLGIQEAERDRRRRAKLV